MLMTTHTRSELNMSFARSVRPKRTIGVSARQVATHRGGRFTSHGPRRKQAKKVSDREVSTGTRDGPSDVMTVMNEMRQVHWVSQDICAGFRRADRVLSAAA